VVRIAGPSLPYDPTYHLLWRVDKIRDVVRREHPDVLEIHSPYVAAASVLSMPRAWFGIRTFTWHSDFIDTYLRVMLERHLPPAPTTVLLAPFWAMMRTIARGCDATFVAAKWQVEKLRAHGLPRVVHVPFGVERAEFTPARASEARRRELLGPFGAAHPDARLLVGVGRFAVEKRWDVVLDAFVALRRTHDAVLVLFGDGPERERMQARVAGRDDVRFEGFVRDRSQLASALASADALVHACPYETFGLSIAEAMSCGLPVVVPDLGGAAELADDASAERYASLDVDACARAMARMLAREATGRDALRRAAVRAAEQVPNVRGQFESLFAEYRRLLAVRADGARGARDGGGDVHVAQR
jgi:alpha-1,6-mannosyltransferase